MRRSCEVAPLFVCAWLATAGCTGEPAPAATDTSAAADLAVDAAAQADSTVDAAPQPDVAVEAATQADTADLGSNVDADAAADAAEAVATDVDATMAIDTAPDTPVDAAEIAAQCKSVQDCPPPPACTAALCVGGTCQSSAVSDGTPCAANEKCAAAAACHAGVCKASAAKACDDGNPCTADACDPATGQCGGKPAAGGPCDDGNPCTAKDLCGESGQCVGTNDTCGTCKSNYECQLKDDGNPCNGTLYCNDSASPPVCATLPGSVPTCSGSAGPCATIGCSPATGACIVVKSPDNSSCSDGDPCTGGDACGGGQCKGALSGNCGCSKDSDCKDDGDLCNGTPYCNATTGQCAVSPTTVKSCPASTAPCKKVACQPSTGACVTSNVGDGTPCNDGLPSTKGDACTAGVCAGTDTYACKSIGDCAKFEDGDYCNGTLYCNKATGKCEINSATGVVCPTVDDTACTKNVCQPKTGKCAMVPAADGAACSDGNLCTTSDSCTGGVCKGGANTCGCQADADCLAKEDGNLCNGTLYCDKNAAPFACKLNPATVVTCPSVNDTACSHNACAPTTGKCGIVAQNEGGACDADGNPCTATDTCKAGACTAGASVCQCQSDSDCAAKDDGDLCNGTLYCDKAQKKCVVNPATIVFCTSVDNGPCSKNVCVAKTGLCAQTAVNQGLPCEDGNPLTVSDVCDAGTCAAGSPSKACKTTADCATDGDKCVQMYCDATGTGVCQIDKAKTVHCAKAGAGACAIEQCNPATGLCVAKALPEGTMCGAGTKCTGISQCKGGSCATGKAADCDDVNPCTVDACDLALGCTHTAAKEGAKCDDGSQCTANDVCGKGQCNGALVATDDGNACTTDSCVPLQGVVHAPLDATACDDGSACTVGDICTKGLCTAGAGKPDCDDKLACTTDSCSPTVGCLHTGNSGAACDDGSQCTTDDTCAKGTCTGSPLPCNDSQLCTTDSCDKVKGCVFTPIPNGSECSDGSACTGGDACNGGLCFGGPVVDCNDGEACTNDSCGKATGCAHAPKAEASKCSDANPCTTGDSCKSAKCVGAAVNCNDDNPCTDDACDVDLGKCVTLPSTATQCNDGNPCTLGDSCKAGNCKGGTAKSCDDGKSCTTDSCDPLKDCVHIALVGAACSDGSLCTDNDACTANGCVGKLKFCDDSVFCTLDSCDPAKGCVALPKPATTACDDNSACTGPDACAKGVCTGATTNCDDGNVCSTDTCDNTSGCKNTLLDKVVCDDSQPCTENDVCTFGVCKATPRLGLMTVEVVGGTEVVGGAVLDKSDGLVVVGGYLVADVWSSQSKDGFVARIDKGGKLLYAKFWNGLGTQQAHGVTAGPNGQIYVVGQWDAVAALPPSSKSQFYAVRMSEDGGTVWSHKDKDNTDGIYSAVALVGTKLVATGSLNSKPVLQGLSAADGSLLWSAAVTANAADTLLAVTAVGTDSVIAVGRSTTDKGLLAVRYTAAGTKTWVKTFVESAIPEAVARGVAALGANFLLAGSSFKVDGYPLVHVIDGNGGLVWKHMYTDFKFGGQFSGAVAMPDGGALALGRGVSNKLSYQGLAIRFGKSGETVFTDIDFAGANANCHGGGTLDDGTLAIACTTTINAVVDVSLARTDSWGSLTCTDSGACSTKPFADCDDANPCTTDSCSAASGCGHAKTADGISCGGGKTCLAGVCK